MRPSLRGVVNALSILMPFVIPLAALGIWLISECSGQQAENAGIVASIDASGSGTTYLSTVLADGGMASWTCSAGRFTETGEPSATGRSVTWTPDPGFADSVTIVVATPTAADSIRFLPFIPVVTPSLTVSAAYHLAVMDRARDIHLNSGAYLITVEDDNLSGYDGVTVLVVHEPGQPRRAYGASPGDTLRVDLPLGGRIEAVGLDHTENALDNGGSVLVTFLPDSSRTAP